MRVAMLDMGGRKYGDATFCEVDGISILVDGAHRGDDQQRDGEGPSIPRQLKELVGSAAPLAIDLLVVTHCHADHIGCLPELIGDGVIVPRWALIADPRIGFGIPLDEDFPLSTFGRTDGVAAALREEPLPADSPASEIRDLIDTAATLQERYATMIEALEAKGTRVVRYGRDPHFALEKEFGSIGLKILGPNVDQLLICAHRVERDRQARKKAATEAAAVLGDGRDDEVAIYRRLVEPPLSDGGEVDDGGSGAAINNQSIVLRIGRAPDAILLTGDMQLASSGVGGLRSRMAALRQVITNAGPYAFARLPHHGASNGTDSRFLDAISETHAYGISTGSDDPAHPSAKVLSLLGNRRPSATWGRTDQNGMVTVRLTSGSAHWTVSRGTLSDGAANGQKAKAQMASAAAVVAAPGRADDRADRPGRLAAAPRLTFVTSGTSLRERIGDVADEVMDRVRSAGHVVLDLTTGDLKPGDVARAARGSNGLVILGGHGVVPLILVDALPSRLRRNLRKGSFEPDDFVVWTDDPYGDADGTGLPQIPVSRIPDARDGSFILKALDPAIRPSTERYGLRNVKRPFAEGIFDQVGGSRAMLTSEPLRFGGIQADDLDVANVYLVLHGYPDDASYFSGETKAAASSARHVRVMSTASMPEICSATVFAGACYGALIVRDPAMSEPAVHESMALSFLNAGARAFVGSVGTHWSPGEHPYRSASGPFHDAFWREIAAGQAPAMALMNAKIDYVFGMPYDGDRAIEYKTWRQVTCLGLGW